jgi:hypothetical protein
MVTDYVTSHSYKTPKVSFTFGRAGGTGASHMGKLDDNCGANTRTDRQAIDYINTYDRSVPHQMRWHAVLHQTLAFSPTSSALACSQGTTSGRDALLSNPSTAFQLRLCAYS